MKVIPLAEDMKNIVEDIISSYETRIQSIGVIFDTTHQLLEGFHESLLDTKQEREKLSAELRENLAKNKSLRRKDFDNMQQSILSVQDEREKEVRYILKNYLNDHKEMAFALRENLSKVKSALANGEAERIKSALGGQAMIKSALGGLAKQDERKNEVTAKLKEFQKQQQELAKGLKGLLAKGRELRIKDLKIMLEEFQTQHKGRIAGQIKRRRDVRSTLDEFKKERLETRKNWQDMQQKLAQRRNV